MNKVILIALSLTIAYCIVCPEDPGTYEAVSACKNNCDLYNQLNCENDADCKAAYTASYNCYSGTDYDCSTYENINKQNQDDGECTTLICDALTSLSNCFDSCYDTSSSDALWKTWTTCYHACIPESTTNCASGAEEEAVEEEEQAIEEEEEEEANQDCSDNATCQGYEDCKAECDNTYFDDCGANSKCSLALEGAKDCDGETSACQVVLPSDCNDKDDLADSIVNNLSNCASTCWASTTSDFSSYQDCYNGCIPCTSSDNNEEEGEEGGSKDDGENSNILKTMISTLIALIVFILN